MAVRNSGLLLHISSLPGDEGIGTMGKEAFHFVDFLQETGQTLWQILPIGPTGFGNSPYMCYSAFAGNPLLIDLKLLVDDNFLTENDFPGIPKFPARRIDFQKVIPWKFTILRKAFENFRLEIPEKIKGEYAQF